MRARCKSHGSQRVLQRSLLTQSPTPAELDIAFLADNPDLLLGLDPDTDRVERVTYLPDGSTPLLYTDGLVERRDESLDDGLRRLSMALAAAGDARPEEVCDRLLHAMLPEAPETTSRCSCCARTQSPRRVIPDGSIRTHAEAQT